jgi:hypothetical protein
MRVFGKKKAAAFSTRRLRFLRDQAITRERT